MDEELAAEIAGEYVRALLRSRAALDRILLCIAEIARRDEQCARTLAAHPEALAALSRAVRPEKWLLDAAGKAGKRAQGRVAKVSAERKDGAGKQRASRITKRRRRKQ